MKNGVSFYCDGINSTIQWIPSISKQLFSANPKMRIELEGFNLTNRQDSAIDYYYASRLPNEPAAVNDIHFHPIESRSFRVTFTENF